MLPLADKTKKNEELSHDSGSKVLKQEFDLDIFEDSGLIDLFWMLPRSERRQVGQVHSYADSSKGYAGLSFQGTSSSGFSSVDKVLFGIEDESIEESLLEGDLEYQACQKPFLVRGYANRDYDVAERPLKCR